MDQIMTNEEPVRSLDGLHQRVLELEQVISKLVGENVPKHEETKEDPGAVDRAAFKIEPYLSGSVGTIMRAIGWSSDFPAQHVRGEFLRFFRMGWEARANLRS